MTHNKWVIIVKHEETKFENSGRAPMILIGQYIFELMEQFWLVKTVCYVITLRNCWSIRAIYSGEMDNRDKGIMHQTLCLHIWIFDESYEWVIAHDS